MYLIKSRDNDEQSAPTVNFCSHFLSYGGQRNGSRDINHVITRSQMLRCSGLKHEDPVAANPFIRETLSAMSFNGFCSDNNSKLTTRHFSLLSHSYRLSVCLSVRPSVTSPYGVKTNAFHRRVVQEL